MGYILVVGGAGYIGSHTVLALEAAGFRPLVFDNLSSGHADAVEGFPLIEGDIRDRAALDAVFKDYDIEAVIHFAAFIEAGESMHSPLKFFDNNMVGSLRLLEAMQAHSVTKLIFSSTAAVYGIPDHNNAITEEDPKAPVNPYGTSKLMVEHMMKDAATAHDMQMVALRYFNAAGADPEGRTGERHDPETHLIPLVLQAAMGVRENISIFGTDYPTPDGTCVRDYIHVADLADAHVKALLHLLKQKKSVGYFDAFNLGNGAGYSVRQVVDMVRRITGKDFKIQERDRRPGDPPVLIASSEKARKTLNWSPTYAELENIIAHAHEYCKKTLSLQ